MKRIINTSIKVAVWVVLLAVTMITVLFFVGLFIEPKEQIFGFRCEDVLEEIEVIDLTLPNLPVNEILSPEGQDINTVPASPINGL